jgi:hypothetical protein
VFLFGHSRPEIMQPLPPSQRKISSLILEELKMLLTPKTVLVLAAPIALSMAVAHFFF